MNQLTNHNNVTNKTKRKTKNKIKKSKKCKGPRFKKTGSLDCFLMSLDDMLLEGYELIKPEISPRKPELITSKSQDIEKVFLMDIDLKDKSLNTLMEKIHKIIVKCNDFDPVMEFIRCYIKNETKNKNLFDELTGLELNTTKVKSLEQLIKNVNPNGYDIFKEDEYHIIEQYAKVHFIINYLLNIIKMIFQFQKGTGYFSQINSEMFKRYNEELIKKDCEKILKCNSRLPSKDIQYLFGISERAIVYDLFLPDSSFLNKDVDESNIPKQEIKLNNITNINNTSESINNSTAPVMVNNMTSI
jgi:hypothetical protein